MKKNVIIVVLLLLVIGLSGYIGYDYLTYKKENKTPAEKVKDDKNKNDSVNELKRLDDSKDLIYSNTETIGKLVAVVNDDYCFETKEEFENWIKLNPENSKTEIEGYKKDVSIIDNNANIILNYPTINIDNDTVNKLNAEIKDYIDKGKENIKKGDNSLYGIKLIIDNEAKYNTGFYWNEVLTIESSNYISIIFKELSLANCAGGGYNIDKIKYIDKETGLEVSEYDILAKYNYQNINDLKSSIKVDEEDGIDLSSIHSPYIDKNEKLHVFVTLNWDQEYIVENNELKDIE